MSHIQIKMYFTPHEIHLKGSILKKIATKRKPNTEPKKEKEKKKRRKYRNLIIFPTCVYLLAAKDHSGF